MTFEERDQITKKNSDDLLSQLIYYQGEDLISEILRLGIQSLMELERDEHIGVGSYERGDGVYRILCVNACIQILHLSSNLIEPVKIFV